jgi:hypothetical protein
MCGPIGRLSRLLASLRWLFMPLGLFALIAVGAHEGANAADDWLLVSLDWLDGLFDRFAAWLLPAAGGLLGASAERIDRWVFAAASLVDLRERALLARGGAVGLELLVDLTLALPALGYREHAGKAPSLEARLVEARAIHGLPPLDPQGSMGELRLALLDPTLLRLLLPLATGAVAVAGSARMANEAQAAVFGALSTVVGPSIAAPSARLAALLVLGGVLVSLGSRATLQSLWWAHGRAEKDRKAGRSASARRLRGALRLAVAAPIAAAALIGAPLLSFFR